MNLRIQQAAAVLLLASAALVGTWALAAPSSFYDDFPLPGHHWVSVAGPYNEHLVTDVGGLYLALGVVTAWAIARPAFLLAAGLAWEVFSIPHLVFHAGHLEGLETFDKWAEVGSLAGTVVLAALLLVPARTGSRR